MKNQIIKTNWFLLVILSVVLVGYMTLKVENAKIRIELRRHENHPVWGEGDTFLGAHIRAYEARFGKPFRRTKFTPPFQPGRFWSGALAEDFVGDLEERVYASGSTGYMVLVDVQSQSIISIITLSPGDGDYSVLELPQAPKSNVSERME